MNRRSGTLRALFPALLVGLLLGLLLGGCVSERSPVTGEKQRLGFSWEQEKELGRKADQQISAQMGIYDDAQVQAYVDRVAQRVLASSDFRKPDLPERYRDTAFTFRVLDSHIVNAFALPGGFVYVTRGLLAHVENEAQLAVVLGHEIGHVAARHSAQQALKQQLSQVGLVAGVIVGSQVLGGGAGDLLQLGGGAMQLLLNAYSREHEREADRLGVRYAAAAGYEAAQGAGFFTTLDRKAQAAGAAIPSWQSTHPDPGEREENIIELARELGDRYRMEVVATASLMRAIDGLVVGSDPRQGFLREGTFYHPDLAFQFDPPQDWRVKNETRAVIMAEPERRALMAFEITPADSAAAAAAEFAGSDRVQVVRRGNLTVNGLPAYAVESRAEGQGGLLGLMNVYVEYDDRVYSFSGYTAAKDYERYDPRFGATAQSFEPLSDPQVLAVKAHRLTTFQTDRPARFERYLPKELPPELDASTLAIMNQVEPDAEVPAGRWLKIPRR